VSNLNIIIIKFELGKCKLKENFYRKMKRTLFRFIYKKRESDLTEKETFRTYRLAMVRSGF